MSVDHAVSASVYTELTISKDDKKASIAGKSTEVEYFESIYSPMITVNVIEVDSGGDVSDDKGNLGTVKDNLPITGLEDVRIKIETGSGMLDLTKEPLKVNGSPTVSQDALRQSVLLPLVSKHEVKNRDVPIRRKLTGKINTIVEKLLNEDIKIKKDKLDIEETQNVDTLIGRNRTAFKLITGLCKRSLPAKGDPGFFFYETQDGFNFKSIESLINQEPKQEYFYTGALKSNVDNYDNDYKILAPPVVKKDQDILTALESGTYKARIITTNPWTHKITEDFINLVPNSTLGKSPEPKDSIEDKNNAIRTYHHILDIGSYDPHIKRDTNNSPFFWEAQSSMRYDLLHSQIMEILIPCNVKLRAGDVIKCNFEKITQDNKVDGIWDEHKSGKYLILHLCHHFDPTRSFTSLTLARDTYGLYTSKK